MLAYAASRPTPVERRPHPNAMLAIIAIHVGVAALIMSAKMDLPPMIRGTPIHIFTVPPPPAPPPPTPPSTTVQQPQSTQTTITKVDPIAPIPHPTDPVGPAVSQGDPQPMAQVAMNIPVYHPPVHNPVRRGAALLTSGDDLKPPYPSSKLLTEEEAVLTLRLSIDERGRVVGVEPVGKTDPVFLAAARRHLLAHWRYRPASEDGRPLASSAVITLRFQLDG